MPEFCTESLFVCASPIFGPRPRLATACSCVPSSSNLQFNPDKPTGSSTRTRCHRPWGWPFMITVYCEFMPVQSHFRALVVA
ncbi:hypothetical protein BDN71DRAFT_470851 [Pleurotus eryngii]|uniref:Uncharacterized protein n=1 Tax=Pleurotus eryngii TaxID=5323 RepID=A0A9P6DKA6_PLEER|nr:hypothetical protein BDN71DRAFT_470851 [Pleurotus eryngii]